MNYYNNNRLSIMPDQNPPMLSIGQIVNPNLVPKAKADPTPALTETFNKKRKVKAASKGPVSKEKSDNFGTKEDPAYGDAIDAAAAKPKALTDQLSALDKALRGMGVGRQATANAFSTAPPESGDFATALAQGALGRELSVGGEAAEAEEKKWNNLMLQEAMQNYLAKAKNPYRGVDLEGLEKQAATLFGARPSGIKNVAEPVNEFNVLAGAAGNITEAKDARSKAILDYARDVLKPQLAGKVSAENEQPRSPNGSFGLQQAKFDASLEDKLRNETSKIITPYTAEKAGLDKMKEAYAKNDFQTSGIMLAQFARSVGAEKGVISDRDITRLIPGSIYKTWAELESYFSKTPTSKLDPKYTKGLRDLIDLAYRKTNEKYQQDLAIKSKGWRAPESQYGRILGDRGAGTAVLGEAESLFKKGDAAAAPKAGMTPEQVNRLAELRAKQGKK